MATQSTGFAAGIEKDAGTTNQFKTFLSRYFYFCMSLAMAGLVVWGFSHTVEASLFHASPPRPLILWVHGAAFATWVIFFIVQSALVRVRKVSVHRFLGWFGAGIATAMVALGFTVALASRWPEVDGARMTPFRLAGWAGQDAGEGEGAGLVRRQPAIQRGIGD